jgi:hypothetical protein
LQPAASIALPAKSTKIWHPGETTMEFSDDLKGDPAKEASDFWAID